MLYSVNVLILTCNPMRKIFLATIAVVALTPSLVAAAQPTASSIIRQSLRSWGAAEQSRGQAIKLDLAVNYQKTYNDKKVAPDQYTFKLNVGGTDFPVNELQSNSELTYSVPQLTIKTDGQTLVDATNAFSADARLFPVEKALYVRLNHLDGAAVSRLDEFGIKIKAVMGSWIKFGLNETESLLGTGEATALSVNTFTDETELKALRAWYLANELKLGSPVIISSAGRITKNANGEKVQTVRVIPNSRWYAAVETLALKEYKKNNPDATAAEVREFQKDFKAGLTKFKQVVAKTTVQVTVNLTTAKITGVTVAFKDNKVAYRTDYSYVRGKEVVKKIAEGREALTLNAGLGWSPAVDSALGEPNTALTPEMAWDLVYTKPTSTLDMEKDADVLGLN